MKLRKAYKEEHGLRKAYKIKERRTHLRILLRGPHATDLVSRIPRTFLQTVPYDVISGIPAARRVGKMSKAYPFLSTNDDRSQISSDSCCWDGSNLN